MARIAVLMKPLTRRTGNLVVRVDETGIAIKRIRQRKWKRCTWEQVAFLSGVDQPVLRDAEIAEGRRRLWQLLRRGRAAAGR